jgi:uncharacterized iron-regulated membrane protein
MPGPYLQCRRCGIVESTGHLNNEEMRQRSHREARRRALSAQPLSRFSRPYLACGFAVALTLGLAFDVSGLMIVFVVLAGVLTGGVLSLSWRAHALRDW